MSVCRQREVEISCKRLIWIIWTKKYRFIDLKVWIYVWFFIFADFSWQKIAMPICLVTALYCHILAILSTLWKAFAMQTTVPSIKLHEDGHVKQLFLFLSSQVSIPWHQLQVSYARLGFGVLGLRVPSHIFFLTLAREVIQIPCYPRKKAFLYFLTIKFWWSLSTVKTLSEEKCKRQCVIRNMIGKVSSTLNSRPFISWEAVLITGSSRVNS